MPNTELHYKSASELGLLIRSKEISVLEITQAHLERISDLEPSLNSFITILGDMAIKIAKTLDNEVRDGNFRGPLHGVPLGMKDVYATKDIRTTYGSRIFDSYMPSEDSATVIRLRNSGTVLLGKLNLHTLEFGPTGQNDTYGDMHNPWDTTRYTGGSSGGSASAVAAGECTLAMGSDSGGSIRVPAALCGLVGLKPTFGLITRNGLMELSPSMDHHGPMTRTVEDSALMLDVLIGGIPSSSPTKKNTSKYTRDIKKGIQGLKIGVPKEFFEVPIDTTVRRCVEEALMVLERLGATVSEVSWPMFHHSYAIAAAILTADAAESLRSLLSEHGTKIDKSVRLRTESGLFIPISRYLQAQRARAILNKQSAKLLTDVDILAGPTVATPAPKIGTTEVDISGTKTHIFEALSLYTRPDNLTGHPTISIPCGFSPDKLPIGLQLSGRAFDESTVLRTAYAYEQATTWHKIRPPL